MANNPDFNRLLAEGLKQLKPTNRDRLRAMSDEELAEFIILLFCEDFPCHPGVVDFSKCKEYMNNCFPCWLDWLKQEVDNG